MAHIYPEIKISRIQHPNRLYAIPLFGFFVKVVMIIPVGLELWVLKMVQFFVSILNACNIFFRARYWKVAYTLNLGIMQLETNVGLFLFGMTDRYPGFSLKPTTYSLDIDFNKNPSRILATPLFGLFFRFILTIPYTIYAQIISLAAFLAVVVSWMWVLFGGVYPETTYEIVRDSVRISQAENMYFLGMSDSYPSFWLSLNHKMLKILLLLFATVLFLSNFGGRIIGGFFNHQQPTFPVKRSTQQQINPPSSY